MARRWPALFSLVAVHRLNTPRGVQVLERVLKLIRSATTDDETAARAFRAIGYYLTGACLDETAGYARGPSAADPVTDEFVAEHCPSLIRAAPYFSESQWDKTFTLGADAVLRSLEPGARKRRAGVARPHKR